MRLSEYAEYDAIALADLVQSGSVSGAELAKTARQAIETYNPSLNAVIETFPEDELAPDGVFRGVPFLIKDTLLQRAGTLCESGSRLAAGFRATADSSLMQRFRAMGLNTIGRTAVPEFGFAGTTESVANGPTRNPWNLDHMVGGSSGGSAAAVACGMVPVAHGSDGAGSLRGPAACCGIFAVKPTRGRVSLEPVSGDFFYGMLIEGVMSRSVRDSAAFLDAIAGGVPGEPYVIAPPSEPYLNAASRDPKKLRIAVALEPWSGAPIDGEVINAVRDIANLCAELGHDVDFARPELDHEPYRAANLTLLSAGMAKSITELGELMNRVPSLDNLETATYAMYERGRKLSAADLLTVPATFNTITRSFGRFFQSWDILLTPATATPPRPIGTYNQNAAGLTEEAWWDYKGAFVPFLAAFNVTGQPAMSLPLAQSAGGLPIGIQAAADFGREDLLFSLAGQLERALPWTKRMPPMSQG